MAHPTPTALRRALRRAADGNPLDVTEAAVLMGARGDALEELCEAAARVRDAGLVAARRPRVVTYSRKVFIPLTRLCRDRCHYCAFATTPGRLPAAYLSFDEIVATAERGRGAGCKEALFTLGDRPEERWPAARAWLDSRGYASTLDYLRAAAVQVLEQTGLLPHLNPGVMSWQELARLKPVAPSMGMMLETTAARLWSEPGGPHYGSPDKDPAVRLRVLEDAGRHSIPFTTGILVGIGETRAERAESLLHIRRIAREYGGIQEVIVQNYRAKPDTAMGLVPDVDLEDFVATVAVARLILGPGQRIQAPPNLVDLDSCARLLRAGIDDWGGISPVTPDHVNPERPWPDIEALSEICRALGFMLRERLTAYPGYLAEPWLDPRLRPHVDALMAADGLADESVLATGQPWQPTDDGLRSRGRVELAVDIDITGRRADRRADFESVYGDWGAVRERLPARRTIRLDGDVRAALAAAEREPAGLSDEQAVALMCADGEELEALARLADEVRRDDVGDTVTYVVNRNINFTNVCYVGCRFCAFAQRRSDADAYSLSLAEVGDRAFAAWQAGATEVCMQGGIDPDLPADGYFRLAAEVKRQAPGLHVHAFSPMEVCNGAARCGWPVREWLVAAKEAGVDSLPGTAAEILDDDLRWVLTKGKLPAAAWIEVVTTAHSLGIPTTATMMYGHVDAPMHWVRHLKLIAQIQSQTGGFTEFVPLPFVHYNAPLYLAGLARSGPTERENRAVHAMARLLLHGRIRHIQCSWVKLGSDGAQQMLRGGADDLGGTLMEETISRMAGSVHGSMRTPAELERIPLDIGRPVRQRTTTYGEVSAERRATVLAAFANWSRTTTTEALDEPPTTRV